MAQKRRSQAPVQGGVKRRNNRQPMISATGSNSSVISYSVLGGNLNTPASGPALGERLFAPGNPNGLALDIGSKVVSYYSSARFLPGTTVKWTPSVSFTTSGRIYVGFTDNPEVMAAINGLTGTAFMNAVKGLGDVQSFPVWQETAINFPVRYRRKMFDVNGLVLIDANVLDRSCQVGMFYAAEGAPPSITLGSMWFHDKVQVEGMHPVAT